MIIRKNVDYSKHDDWPKMTDVPRKRYRRTDLEKESESSGSDPEEELYVPLKERRKLQFSEIEKAAGIKNRFELFFHFFEF